VLFRSGPSIANVSKARFKLQDVINWFTKKQQAKELKHGFPKQFKSFISRLKSHAESENGYIPVNYVYHDINDYVAYWPSDWSREEYAVQGKLQNKHAKELYSAIRSELKMYDSKGNPIKELSSMNEAKKQNYGAGYSVVKEKKMKTPKDGMTKMEEDKEYMETKHDSSEDMAAGMIKKETKDTEIEMKTRSLEELKAAKAKLDKKIKQMEGVNENVEEGVLDENEALNLAADIVNWIVSHGKDAVNAIKTMDPETLQYLAGVTGISGLGAGIGTYLNKKETETGVSQLPMTNKSRGL